MISIRERLILPKSTNIQAAPANNNKNNPILGVSSQLFQPIGPMRYLAIRAIMAGKIKDNSSLITINQKPRTGNLFNFSRNHFTCLVLSPGGAYVLIKSNNGGATKINLIINGIIRIRIYASHGEVGGTSGKTNTSSMKSERRAIAMNLSI